MKPWRRGLDPERERLLSDANRKENWKRWGPYLAERQWGTVREDYSADGTCWDYFPHEHARSRAYRWGEDGLLGFCDREGRVCFALALWNGRDRILKERLFGLTGPQGNHGEDVKEVYFYLDSTPTHSYFRSLYKYPQAAFPYDALLEENGRRDRDDREYELEDTGVFDESRYFDIEAEYAKAAPDDILIRLSISNRGPEAADLHLLPTVWLRNTWSWGRTIEGYWPKGAIRTPRDGVLTVEHPTLPPLEFRAVPTVVPARSLLTENETNAARVFGATPVDGAHSKDAFHRWLIEGESEAVRTDGVGTKAAFYYRLAVPAGETVIVRLRMRPVAPAAPPLEAAAFDALVTKRREECDQFYAPILPETIPLEQRRIARQAYAGLLHNKQFYHYVVGHWLDGDPAFPPPPAERLTGRNREWRHLHARDVISMPDAWEYPWFAAWDLAFHLVALARIDAAFAKEQLLLFLREWYLHPSGQLAAYEFAFGDVNPPVHAWAAWRVYKITGRRGKRDTAFLSRVFQKLLLEFTWWVNRKDLGGKNIFAGGFLGLDNVGVFDRSKPLPTGGTLEQADGTAWMAFYCSTMLSMALELARENPVYEDMASKFFEHFVAIIDAMNGFGGTGLWDPEDGFYYDQLNTGEKSSPLKLRSIVGIIPLFAVEILDADVIDRLPGFQRRLQWFLDNRPDLARHVYTVQDGEAGKRRSLLSLLSPLRLQHVLQRVLDETEFLSPHGIRSLSRAHLDPPYALDVGGEIYRVRYDPAESTSGLFGGNSNWRGPVWFPVNFLLIEALERYHNFYGDALQVECPTGSGRFLDLAGVARELSRRLVSLFEPDAEGRRPASGDHRIAHEDPHWRDHILFHEYFDGDTGRGCGASHQTGWTALVAPLVTKLHRGSRPRRRRTDPADPATSSDGR